MIYKDIGIGFHRLNKIPLDESMLSFNSINELFKYIKTGVAYDGQILILHESNIIIELCLVKDKNNDLKPIILNWPNEISMITKTYNGDKYILVYYYNGGSNFIDASDTYRISDPFSWVMLPYISIINGSDKDINYLLEVTTINNITRYYSFIQDDISDYRNGMPSTKEFDTESIDAIYNFSNSFNWYCTSDPSIGIMVKSYNNNKTLLWIKANEYLTLINGGC